jgi:microcystin degradation protein MlrC
VDRATYDAIKGEYLDRLKALLPLDGVYMPMRRSGQSRMEDAEGDLVCRHPRRGGAARDPVGQL